MELKFLARFKVDSVIVFPEKRINRIRRSISIVDFRKEPPARHTEAIEHHTEAIPRHTEAVSDRRKLLLCGGTNQLSGDPNQLNGELNQRYDVKFLLTGDQSQRGGGGLERWGDKNFREAEERVLLEDDVVQRRCLTKRMQYGQDIS